MVADYIAAVLADNPAAFWKLQDAADFPQDSSGNGKHMDTKTIVSSLTYRAIASSFGPRDSFCIFQSTAALERSTDTVLTATDNISMEIWIKTLTSGATLEVFFIGAATGVTNANVLGANGWGLSSSNGNRPVVRTINAGAVHDVASTASLLSGGNWQHIVIVRRSGTWELWVNGVQDTSIGTFTNAPGPYSGQVVYIGQASSTVGQNLSFFSAFAALYNSALTGTRILAHYNAMLQWENAAYEELSWLGLGSGSVSNADGAGVSIFA